MCPDTLIDSAVGGQQPDIVPHSCTPAVLPSLVTMNVLAPTQSSHHILQPNLDLLYVLFKDFAILSSANYIFVLCVCVNHLVYIHLFHFSNT